MPYDKFQLRDHHLILFINKYMTISFFIGLGYGPLIIKAAIYKMDEGVKQGDV